MAGPQVVEPVLSTRRRAALLSSVVAVMIAAELLLVLAAVARLDLLALLGLIVDVVLVLSLPVLAALTIPKDRPLGQFLGALVLAPLLRVVSVSTPLAHFSLIQWLGILAVPLLIAGAAIIEAQGLRPRDVFLGVGKRRYLPLNAALVVSGLPLGFLEYQILHPPPTTWISAPDPGQLTFAAIVAFFSTGLAEELIFRGILLRTGIPVLGLRGTVLYVTLVFAVLHIGFMSWADLLLVVLLGLLFSGVVVSTGSLWGAAGAYALANVALYVLFPLGLL